MFKNSKKRNVIIILILSIIFFIVTDPDAGLITNLTFGSSLILVTEIFLLSILGMAVVEMVTDVFLDDSIGTDHSLSKEAMQGNKEAATLMMAKSVRMLGAAIIITGVITAIL